jgi:hypothetical protein
LLGETERELKPGSRPEFIDLTENKKKIADD